MQKASPIQDIYPLSGMQEGILYHSLLDQRAQAYFEQITLRIQGEIRIDRLEQSFNRVIARHDVFRSLFITDKVKRPQQVVLKERPVSVYYEDLSPLPVSDQDQRVKQFEQEDRARGFNLQKDPLMRLAVFKHREREHVWVWSHHHIIMDGWCISKVVKEIIETYQALARDLPPPYDKAVPYSRYIQWLQRQDPEEARQYWSRYLAGYDQLSSIPGMSDLREQAAVFAEYTFTLDPNSTAKLNQLAAEQQVTLNTVVQSLWGVLLQQVNQVDDVVFGAVVSGRPAAVDGVEEMIGLFINTIPVRVTNEPGMPFKELLRSRQRCMLEANDYSFVSLAEIQGRSLLKSGLIDHLMVFQNYPIERSAAGEGQQLEEEGTLDIASFETFEQTNYPLTVMVSALDEVAVKLTYDPSVYRKEQMEGIGRSFISLAQQFIGTPDVLVQDMALLPADEQLRLIEAYNDTAADFPQEQTLHQWFEEQTERTPAQTAVYADGAQWTYEELNERSNKLAHALRDAGVGRNHIVAVLTYRSIDMMTALLAVLKAGGAYLPIPPDYPQDRIQYMLEDSKAAIVLTHDDLLSGLALDAEVWGIGEKVMESKAIGNPVRINDSCDLAYIIYTSGSTGNPKGVMIEHRSIINRLCWMQKRYPLQQGDVILQKTPFAFDVSVWELFWWYMAGAAVSFLEPGGEKEPRVMLDAIARHQVTTMHFVPSMLRLFLEYVELHGDDGKLSSLTRVFASGEALHVHHVDRFRSLIHRAYGTDLVNLYGPTEATVDVSYYDCISGEYRRIVPIGRPIDNTGLYIVGKNGHILPVGVAGELCIGGVNVARGYLHRESLTQEKFVPNPVKAGERMYRTGDLARLLPDGNIEYLGRIDHQVKIRGNRIELGEIENQLAKHADISDAAVICRPNKEGEQELYGYYVAAVQLDTKRLRSWLLQMLPVNMVPTFFIQLEEMPLSANGKINRKALPDVKSLTEDSRDRGEASGDDTQRQLESIWNEILERDQCGIHESFFELGGHSLKAMSLASQIHKQFGVAFPLPDLFANPTIREQALYIASSAKLEYRTIEPAEKQPYYPLTAAQKRVYFMQQLVPDGTTYNMPLMLIVEGEADAPKLAAALEAMIQRHEVLRTSFDLIDSVPVQKVHEKAVFQLEQYTADALAGSESLESGIRSLAEQFVRPFDLTQAPMMRAGLIHCGDGRTILMLDWHHIISDGVTLQLFMEEFIRIYVGETLPDVRLHYKDYAVWQQQTNSERIGKQEAYWLSAFEGDIPLLQLPLDVPRPAVKRYDGDTVSFGLEPDTVSRLGQLCSDSNATMYMVLLASYYVFLHHTTGQEDIVAGTPVAGRIHAELEAVHGMLVNTLALRSRVQPYDTFGGFLQQVKRSVLASFEQQEYPFEELIDRLNIPRDFSRNPLFDTMFVMQTMAGGSFVPGLDAVLRPYPFEYQTAKFDLTLQVMEGSGGIDCQLEYSTSLFRKDTVRRFAHNFERIVKTVAENPNIRIGDIHLSRENGKSIEPKRSIKRALPNEGRKAVKQTSGDCTAPGNPLESELVFIWSRILGVPQVGVHDDFFELGGHSLKAMAIVSMIERRMQAIVPLQQFLLYPTIRELAAAILAAQPDMVNQAGTETAPLPVDSGLDERNERNEQILLLRQGSDSGGHLFFIHGGNGDASGYMSLASRLDVKSSCWGIRLRERSSLSPEPLRIEQLAEEYVMQVKTVQPQGPYTLVGWSLGGAIAYEMARQLTESGDSIRHLILLDSYAPSRKPEAATLPFELAAEKEIASEMVSQMQTDEASLHDGFALIESAATIGEMWSKLARSVEMHRRYPELLHQIRSNTDQELKRMIPYFDELGFKETLEYFHAIRSLQHAVAAYRLEPVPNTPIYHIKASESVDLDAAGWEVMGNQPITKLELEGEHHRMLDRHHAADLAGLMMEIVNNESAALSTI